MGGRRTSAGNIAPRFSHPQRFRNRFRQSRGISRSDRPESQQMRVLVRPLAMKKPLLDVHAQGGGKHYAKNDSRRSWREKPHRQTKSTAGLGQPRHQRVVPACREPEHRGTDRWRQAPARRASQTISVLGARRGLILHSIAEGVARCPYVLYPRMSRIPLLTRLLAPKHPAFEFASAWSQ